jgi:hypothetical protein
MPRASPRRPHPGSHLLPPAAPLRLPPAAVGYAPVLLTVAPAAIAVKAIIWLTVFVMAAAVSLLWRIRRKLADATAVQLTRYPGALAQGYPTLAALDMAVPGAVAVHFLFPVWDPAVDRDHSGPKSRACSSTCSSRSGRGSSGRSAACCCPAGRTAAGPAAEHR